MGSNKKFKITLDWLILKFVSFIQYFSFLTATLADFGLNYLFYYSFGPEPLYKIILGFFGIVITGSKLWAWSNDLIKKTRIMALFCALLSCLGNVMLFNATMETQSKAANLINGQASKIVDPLANLQDQIEKLNKSNDIIQSTISKMTKEEPITIQSLNKTMASNNELIAKLLASQAGIRGNKQEVIIENKIILDAYLIMNQVAAKFGINVQWFGLFFMLGGSIVLELIIGFTTPRRITS